MASLPATGLQPSSSDQPSLTDHNEAYLRLVRQVTGAGFLDRSPVFYFLLVVAAFAGYAITAGSIVLADGLLPLTFACLGFTFFSVQLAGLMHDSGHRAVFSSVRHNDLLGLATSAAIGMVYPSWTTRHNQHHLQPNREGADPDMEIPFIALTPQELAGKDRLQKLVARWQAFYYFPMGGLVAFTNRLGSVTYFFKHRSQRHLWRVPLYMAGLFLLFVAPFLLFPLGKALFVFLLVHVTSGLYLATCFAPNHKGMPTLAAGREMSFLEQQIITSRNVRGGVLTDIALVGLNYQVEHHLFPSCPRNKLKHIQPYVKQLCADLGIEYTEESLLGTNRRIIRHLVEAARMAPEAAV